MPHIDLTSVWIPGGLIGVLVLIMIRLFINERRSVAAMKAEGADQAPAAAPAEAPAAVEPPPMADMPAEAAAAEAPAATEAREAPAAAPAPIKTEAPVVETKVTAAKAKQSLVWRTAWIWLPFLVGFFGQGYLDHRAAIDPLIEKITG